MPDPYNDIQQAGQAKALLANKELKGPTVTIIVANLGSYQCSFAAIHCQHISKMPKADLITFSEDVRRSSECVR